MEVQAIDPKQGCGAVRVMGAALQRHADEMLLRQFSVRPRGRAICRVKVLAGVGHSSVAEGNCVVVRRGGE